LAYTDFLRQDLGEVHPGNKLKQWLWQEAEQQTLERLNNLLLFTFSPQLVMAAQPLSECQIITKMAKLNLDWLDFQCKFALVQLDGAYAVFERCLVLTPSVETYITFIIQQLGRWLPTAIQMKMFEAGSISLTVNLRPIRQDLEQKSLDLIRAELAACELTVCE
jgi:hypothetical protein